MKAEVVRVDAQTPDAEALDKAADILRRGGIVAIPTETVYGLAVKADDKDALGRLYAVKKRDTKKAVTVQIADFSQIKDFVEELPISVEVILKEFWPGPLTVLLKAKGAKKIGLRMPDNKIALSLIRRCGFPLAVTSANISGARDAISAKETAALFQDSIDLILDDASSASGIASTVLDASAHPFKILRRGESSEKLERFLKLYA